MLTPKEKKEAERNLKSRARAIELMCKQCVYMPGVSGTWREQVENNCPQHSCPLYNWRPCVGGEARKSGNAWKPEPKRKLKLEE